VRFIVSLLEVNEVAFRGTTSKHFLAFAQEPFLPVLHLKKERP
jgi:hypothetical protein